MKKALAILAVLLLALTSFAATKTFTIAPITPTCGAVTSSTLTVDEDSTMTDVYFQLAYDTTALTHTGCAAIPPGWSVGTCTDVAGLITVAASGPALAGGTMGLVTLNFTALDLVCNNDLSNLDLTTVTYNAGTSGTAVDGTCLVTCAAYPGVPGAATTPNPVDAATCQTASSSFSIGWAAAPNAASYDVYAGSPLAFVTNTTGLTASISAPAVGTTYSWRIDPVSPCGTTTGTVWTFTTTPAAPAAFANLLPADAALNQPLVNVVLDWADSAGATSYDVWFGAPPAFVANVPFSTYTVAGPLTASTPYSWYVIANGGCSQTTTGSTWTFTTESGTGCTTLLTEGFEGGSMPPAGWTVNHLGTTTREWDLVDAVTYPTYVHSGAYAGWVNYDAAYNSNEWLTTPSIDLTAYPSARVEFWAISDTDYPTATMRVVVTDAVGTVLGTPWDMVLDETWSPFAYRLVTVDLNPYVGQTIKINWQYIGLDGESFGLDDISVIACDTCPLPGAFNLLAPANLAVGQPILDVVLDWEDSAAATSYDVYFGTSNPPTTLAATVAASTYTVTGPLLVNTTYYWYVNAVNTCGAPVPSATWSFTTVVTAPDPDLQLVSTPIPTDICYTGGTGDANGILDPGETATFTIDLTNAGTGPASGVSGTLVSLTTGVTVTAATSAFPDMLPAATVTSTGVYSIDIASTLACGTTVALQLNISANAGAYTTTIAINFATGSLTSPYLLQGFEGTYPPTGWGLYTTGVAGDPGWIRSTASAHSGTASAWHNDDNLTGVGISWLVTPPVALPAGATAITLDFWQRDTFSSGSYYNYHGVSYTTDADPNPATATYTNLWSGDCTTSWAQRTIDVLALAGQTVTFAFEYRGDYADEWFLDDIAVNVTATTPICTVCLPGTPSLAYDSHTFTDVCTGGGTGNGDGVADPGENLSIRITLANSGTAAPTGTQATLTTSTPGVTVTAANSTYPNIAIGGTGTSQTAYLVTIGTAVPCGTLIDFSLNISSNEGSWTDTFQILVGTTGGPTTILAQDFETWPLAGWNIVQNGGCGPWDSNVAWGALNLTGGTGMSADADADSCGSGMDTELRTPSLVLPAVGPITLTYNCNFQDYVGSGDAYTDISVDAGATWTNLRTETNDDPTTGHAVSLDLSAYAGSTAVVRFHFVTGGWDWYWQVDDVLIIGPSGAGACTACTPIPPCIEPDQPQLVSPADGSTGLTAPVVLVWDAAANATAYEVWVGPAPGNLALLATTTDTTYTVETLPEGEAFYWLISAINDCGFAHSPLWSFTVAGGGPNLGNMVFIPAASNKTGDRSSQWKTDLEIMNTGDSPADYTITFIPADTDGTLSTHKITGNLTAGAMKKFENIVTDAFQLTDASGALHLDGTRRLIAASRTYNDTGEGTYGQFVMGYGSEMLMGQAGTRSMLMQGETGHLVNLISGLDFRTNVGFMEVTGKAAAVQVKLFSDTDALLGTRSYDLLPMGFHQVSNIFLVLGITAAHPAARAEITVTGEGAVLAYASVVDNTTNDAVFSVARKVHGTVEERQQVLAVAARAAGALGTQWRTDLRLFNPTDTDLPVTCTYRSDAGLVVPHVVTIPAGNLFYTIDLLQQVFAMIENTHGTLSLSSSAPFIAAGRIYTEVEPGTYGQYAPVLTADQPLPAGGHGYLLGLRKDALYRTNLGLTLASGTTATVRISLFDLSGNPLNQTTHTLAGTPHIQWNDIYGTLGLTGDREGYAKVEVLSGDGTVAAYASIVDNLTNDAIFVPAQ